MAKAYYSAPPEYLGREVWAGHRREALVGDARTVRIFNHRWEQIAMHVRSEPGRFRTHVEHVVKEKISGIKKGANYLLSKVRHIGSQSHDWAQAMLNARGIEGVRVLQGLLSLSKRHASESLEKACKSAAGHQLSHAEFLELVLQDELNIRNQRQIERRVKSASFREVKTLDEFDFKFNPSIKRQQIFELATCRFLREHKDVLLVGPPGTGKSFIAQSIGYQAIKQGHLVLYRSIFDVVRDFLHDEAFEGHDRVLNKYLKPDLLIIDDMGVKMLPRRSGEILFEIIMRRYETRSTMMTSNRPIEEWGKLLQDVRARPRSLIAYCITPP